MKEINRSEVVKLYKQKMSARDIAKQLGTYKEKILKILKEEGVKLRTKAEDQKLVLKQGKSQHPTKGKKREEETKAKISESRADAWNKISDKERKRLSKLARKQWKETSKEDHLKRQKLAGEALRESAKSGSKLEWFLRNELNALGYKVSLHDQDLIPNEALQVDLHIRDMKVVIEVDGITHYEPVWGEERFEKVKSADKEKNGLLLGNGFVVIRLRNTFKYFTDKYKREILNVVVSTLERIKKKRPTGKGRLIHLEVDGYV